MSILKELPGYAARATVAAQIGKQVVEDPYFSEVICEIDRYQQSQFGYAPPPCPRTVATKAQIEKGAGLRYAVTPLRILTFNEQYPLVLPATLLASLGLIFYAGMAAGKRSRR